MNTLKRVLQLSLLCISITPIAVQAAPAAPNLVSPINMQTSQPYVFVWDAVADADWYRVWVKDETGVVVADWVKSAAVCNGFDEGIVVSEGICEYAPATESGTPITIQGSAIWQVRGYGNGELGAWSERVRFYGDLSRPAAAELLEPLVITASNTPTFSWSLVPDATWYKIEVVGPPQIVVINVPEIEEQAAVEELSPEEDEILIISQWLRVGRDNNGLDCDIETNICSVTPMAILPEAFEWRIRTYNAAGLGPWTDGEFVVIIPGAPLSATPNPLVIGECTAPGNYEFMVTNNSSIAVTGLNVSRVVINDILSIESAISAIECAGLNGAELAAGESCVITRAYIGETSGIDPFPAYTTISVTGDNIVPLDIEIEVSEENCAPNTLP